MKLQFELTDRCAFCLKPRIVDGKQQWDSIFIIESKEKKFSITICRSCRKDPKLKIGDIYTKIPELMQMKEVAKNVKS